MFAELRIECVVDAATDLTTPFQGLGDFPCVFYQVTGDDGGGYCEN